MLINGSSINQWGVIKSQDCFLLAYLADALLYIGGLCQGPLGDPLCPWPPTGVSTAHSPELLSPDSVSHRSDIPAMRNNITVVLWSHTRRDSQIKKHFAPLKCSHRFPVRQNHFLRRGNIKKEGDRTLALGLSPDQTHGQTKRIFAQFSPPSPPFPPPPPTTSPFNLGGWGGELLIQLLSVIALPPSSSRLLPNERGRQEKNPDWTAGEVLVETAVCNHLLSCRRRW